MKFLRGLVLGLSCSSICACASQREQPAATQQEKDAALEDYFKCFVVAAGRLDDGKSDAMTVAVAVKSICTNQINAFRYVNGIDILLTKVRMLKPDKYKEAEQKADQQDTASAIEAVLRWRAMN